MLFNSYIFLFCFLPITLCLFLLLGRIAAGLAVGGLTFASLFFYGWWNPHYLILLIGSILFNYFMGRSIFLKKSLALKKIIFITAITFNLILLGFFKYSSFFLANCNQIFGTHVQLPNIILPLGISFFTFTQIAFLVDVYRGEVKNWNLMRYVLFVTYFPHLIAGPILHHKEMLPQFNSPTLAVIKFESIAMGMTIFFIGLFKKVVLADGIQHLVAPVFVADSHPALFESWIGVLAYAFQLYFDFSGYCDMAIGISLLFGIKIPLNFYSPYKATNIIDFWRRWHMTLSRFLREYLYIPLGGNQLGKKRRYFNLFITMLLGGLWHGANWTFVIWGALHGVYLMVNHGWRSLKLNGIWSSKMSGLMTFIAVVFAWVFFRADNIMMAMDVIKGMVGMNGIVSMFETRDLLWVLILGSIIWFFPNTQQIMSSFGPTINSFSDEITKSKFLWRPSPLRACWFGFLGFIAILLMNKHSEFLYFQF